MAQSRAIAYYVSAHGYGHGVRSCDILRAFAERAPEREVLVVSDLPEPFFRNRLGGVRASFRAGAFDVGMVQLDSIRVDVPATLERVARLYARRRELVAAEAALLREQGVTLVVSDIAALPLEAAAAAGVPAVAVGNFGWDWIYEEFAGRDPRWGDLAAAIGDGYARADLLLRLPFSEPMRAFRRIEEVALVASPGRPRREEIARETGARPERRWVLVAFTTLAWDGPALDRIARTEEVEFFTVAPLGWPGPNLHAVDRERISFADVVASVDAVVSKPGFGIVSECVVNGKPLAYADRSDFREYEILVAGIRRYLRAVHLPADRLYAGDLRGALEALEEAPEPHERLEGGGAASAADRLAALAESGPGAWRR